MFWISNTLVFANCSSKNWTSQTHQQYFAQISQTLIRLVIFKCLFRLKYFQKLSFLILKVVKLSLSSSLQGSFYLCSKQRCQDKYLHKGSLCLQICDWRKNNPNRICRHCWRHPWTFLGIQLYISCRNCLCLLHQVYVSKVFWIFKYGQYKCPDK